jgi:N utilization substance protein B
MSTLRDIRRAALQSLYQFDCNGDDQPELIIESLAEYGGTHATQQQGFELAQRIWTCKSEADEAVAALTPEWPTHRQPVLDRNILRLAWFELHREDTPPKVVINEAVELAREFSTEQSPLFVNGVLDKLWKIQRGVSTADGLED